MSDVTKEIEICEASFPHLTVILETVSAIAWSRHPDGGLSHQAVIGFGHLTDLRCALTALGIGKEFRQ